MNAADLGKIHEAIEGSSTIIVACHVDPDGDALGSILALASLLRRNGKEVWAGWGSEDIEVPPQYQFLPGASFQVPSSAPERADLFISLDCADLKRLDLLTDKFRAATRTINIDHHISNEGYADMDLVEGSASSTCELIWNYFEYSGAEPTLDEATCLYTGIVTDTGRFQYSNASPATLRAAADLRARGVDHVGVGEQIYESNSFGYLKVLGAVLARASFEDGLVWSWLERSDLDGVPSGETEHVIDALRAVNGCQVAALAKEQPDGTFKMSLRSTGLHDVSAVARSLGGGGHTRAAGYSTTGDVSAVIAALKEQLSKT